MVLDRHSQVVLPRVPHSQGPADRAVFEGRGWRVESPVQSRPPENFITCCGVIDFNPLIILLINSVKELEIEIFRQKVTYSNLIFENFPGEKPPFMVET